MTFSLLLERDDSLSSSLRDHGGGRYKGDDSSYLFRRRSGVMTAEEKNSKTIDLLCQVWYNGDIGGTIDYNTMKGDDICGRHKRFF